jgi:hypothetical protein
MLPMHHRQKRDCRYRGNDQKTAIAQMLGGHHIAPYKAAIIPPRPHQWNDCPRKPKIHQYSHHRLKCRHHPKLSVGLDAHVAYQQEARNRSDPLYGTLTQNKVHRDLQRPTTLAPQCAFYGRRLR